MLFDLPLDQLKTYKPDREEPPDFDAFWKKTLTGGGTHQTVHKLKFLMDLLSH